ncbi:hypothetical protein DFH09DRAFT_897385 [Mycena vulgaris]|nr:hypothetical protein DFH09DRAFT_897385 [Mycena vulgaris]
MENTNCAECVIRPDPTKAFGGTWYEGTQLPGELAPSVTLSFTGAFKHCLCILANTVPDAITTSDLSFTLDGTPIATFSHVPDSSSDFVYAALVFSVDGLGRGPHRLVLATDNSAGSLVMFTSHDTINNMIDTTTELCLRL